MPVFWTTPCLSHPTMPAFLISLFMCMCFIQVIVFAIHYLHVVACFMGPWAQEFVGVVVLDLVDLLYELAANRSARCILIFFSFLLLLIISRANVMFAYLTDKIRIGLNNTEFARLKTMITQIPLVAVEVFCYGVMMCWLDHMVSALFSVFLKYSLTVM